MSQQPRCSVLYFKLPTDHNQEVPVALLLPPQIYTLSHPLRPEDSTLKIRLSKLEVVWVNLGGHGSKLKHTIGFSTKWELIQELLIPSWLCLHGSLLISQCYLML